MSVEKMAGQVKETTGKLTGDKGMEAEGMFEKGVAEVKGAVGGAVNYVTDLAGTLVNGVTGAVSDLYEGAKKMVQKVF